MTRESSLSRRRLIGLAAAGTASTLLAGCGNDDDGDQAGASAESSARHRADVEVLNGLLAVELEALMFYRAQLPLLRGGHKRAATAVAAQIGKHSDGLAQAIRDLNGEAVKGKAYPSPPSSDGDEVLRSGIRHADRASAAYLDAIPKLGDRRLRGTAAAIATSVAEHPIVLRAALGERALPAELVVGKA